MSKETSNGMKICTGLRTQTHILIKRACCLHVCSLHLSTVWLLLFFMSGYKQASCAHRCCNVCSDCTKLYLNVYFCYCAFVCCETVNFQVVSSIQFFWLKFYVHFLCPHISLVACVDAYFNMLVDILLETLFGAFILKMLLRYFCIIQCVFIKGVLRCVRKIANSSY
jgi:hypothetical protein